MKTPAIHITVDAQGNVRVATQGYQGKACLEASRFLEEALGEVARLTHTPEYHAAGVETRQLTRRG